MNVLARLLRDESGQDLIEYALLTTAIGFAALAGVNLLSTAMNSTYTSWDTAGQSCALVEVDSTLCP
jgi:Flp pilus assembly pilin Flp